MGCSRKWVALALSLTGCDDEPGGVVDAAVDAIDAAPDARVDAMEAIPADWSCLDDPPAPSARESELVAIVEHRTAQRPVADATVRVCRRSEADCEHPTAMLTTDATGEIDVPLPTGDLGYIAIEAEGFVPIFFYSTRGLDDFIAEPRYTLQLIDDATKQILLDLAEVTLEPERGTVLFEARDCTGRLSAGVEVTASTYDERSLRVYVSGPFPDSMARDTDTSGLGAIFNLPSGMTHIVATHTESGRTIASLDVRIAPGYATQISRLVPAAAE